MTSKTVAALLADLEVTKSHSRPRVSNDNPYSESWFKTLKFAPVFPERFGCLTDARAFMADFVEGYNHHHHHTGIAPEHPRRRPLRPGDREGRRTSRRPGRRTQPASRTVRHHR